MNDEERRIITDFVQRLSGHAASADGAGARGPWGGGSVPSTQARAPLPPVDREADQMIAELFTRYPEARYRITQTAFVQEVALVEAQNRIRQLEWEVENARAEAQHATAQPQRGGLFGMFGGGSRQPMRPMAPPPQPVYPPGYNPQMLQQQGRSGPGFLGTAVMTAAGVAGGLVLGNMLMNSFGGGSAHAATAGADHAAGTGAFGQEAVGAGSGASPWTDPSTAAADQGWSGGGADKGNYTGGGNDIASGEEDVGQQASYNDAGGFDDAGGYDEDV